MLFPSAVDEQMDGKKEFVSAGDTSEIKLLFAAANWNADCL